MSEWRDIESAPTREWITAYYWPEWSEEPITRRVCWVGCDYSDCGWVGPHGWMEAFPFTHWKPG